MGIVFVGIVGIIPKDVITRLLGKEKSTISIFKATIAGVLLDLCSHGILLVAMKLYKRGVRLSQVVAFLVASPWNSFSLTIILIAFIGWKWTLAYIFLSMVVAFIAGLITEYFVSKNVLPENPNTESLNDGSLDKKWTEIFSLRYLKDTVIECEVLLRWVFLGVIAAGLIRTFVPTETFTHYFGPTILGMFLTLVAATIIEVCSEGSVPIAYDLFGRAIAPGNAFLFLMAGASTDYTEIMALKETTKSWKIALFLPVVTLPQILFIAYILNHIH